MRPKFINPNHPRRTRHEHGLKPPDIFRPTRSVRHAASHPLSRPPTGGCQTGETINGDAGAEGMRPDARLEIPIPFPVRAFISNGMSWRTCLPDRFCRFNKTACSGLVEEAAKVGAAASAMDALKRERRCMSISFGMLVVEEVSTWGSKPSIPELRKLCGGDLCTVSYERFVERNDSVGVSNDEEARESRASPSAVRLRPYSTSRIATSRLNAAFMSSETSFERLSKSVR